MRDRLRHDLTRALKARDRVAVAAIRSAIAAIENAEAVSAPSDLPGRAGSVHFAGATAGLGSADVERRRLSEADERAILRTQVAERTAAARDYERLGRLDAAERLRREAAVLAAVLADGDRA